MGAGPSGQSRHGRGADPFGELLAASGRLPLGDRRVLDLGCGDGAVLAGLARCGARQDRLVGLDLRPDALAAARARCPESAFALASGTALPHPDASFDVILAFTLFSSILDDRIAGGVAREVGRVLRPGGALVWYDVRVSNPHNPAVRGMPRRRLLALFPGWRATLRPVTLLPPVARRLGRLTRVAYPALAALPQLRTHWVGLLERPR